MSHFLLKFQRVFDKCEEGNQNQRNQLRHMAKLKIAKRVSTALINSLSAGVVPRLVLNILLVEKIAALLQDLENIAEGGAAFCCRGATARVLCCNCS